MGDVAFVSFRLPKDKRTRLARLAKGSGRTLQDFMTELVETRLAEEAFPQGSSLPRVLATLRPRKEELKARGVEHMWVFGSVARGEEKASSDVDIVVELSPEARLTLTGFARLRLDLSDILGRTADLTQWTSLTEKALPSARRDAVEVF